MVAEVVRLQSPRPKSHDFGYKGTRSSGVLLMNSRPWFLLGFVLAMTASASAGETSDTLRVGSWNIEWLGQPTKRASKDPQTAKDIATYINDAGVDLLCLNEITWNVNVGELRSNATLEAACKILR